jgi:hypothetical protein
VKLIEYFCDASCTAKPKNKHMDPGDVIVLVATNTAIKIQFTGRSPFVSGTMEINLPRMTARLEVVAPKPGEYFYTLDCEACPGFIDEPSMIVD